MLKMCFKTTNTSPLVMIQGITTPMPQFLSFDDSPFSKNGCGINLMSPPSLVGLHKYCHADAYGGLFSPLPPFTLNIPVKSPRIFLYFAFQINSMSFYPPNCLLKTYPYISYTWDSVDPSSLNLTSHFSRHLSSTRVL